MCMQRQGYQWLYKKRGEARRVEKVWGLAVNVITECGNSRQGRGWRVIRDILTENKFRTKMG